ncbi:MAG: ChaN family lipoprotein, partial [Lautropia sp.]|nr:ChaN family lipoprotein [Lautropia sp.]
MKLSEKDFLRLVYATDVLLLGEQHDQPLHHQLRAQWLKAWAGAVTGAGGDSASSSTGTGTGT